jgi:hypothetical protein
MEQNDRLGENVVLSRWLSHSITLLFRRRTKVESASFFAKTFGLLLNNSAVMYFSPVQVNETLTLNFDGYVDQFDTHYHPV